MMNSPTSDLPIRVLGPEDEETLLKKTVKVMARTVALLSLLYIFVSSLNFLSSSFRLLGGRAAGRVISHSELLQNPIVGLMIGVLVTVLVQSSSTSTSIVVTMVGSDCKRVAPWSQAVTLCTPFSD